MGNTCTLLASGRAFTSFSRLSIWVDRWTVWLPLAGTLVNSAGMTQIPWAMSISSHSTRTTSPGRCPVRIIMRSAVLVCQDI
ncbi:hypothetical protein D3C86_2028110 [compost metagenome]